MASGERAPVEFVMRDERQERRRAQNRKAQRTLRNKIMLTNEKNVSSRAQDNSLLFSDSQRDQFAHFPTAPFLSHRSQEETHPPNIIKETQNVEPHQLNLSLDNLGRTNFEIPPMEGFHWDNLDGMSDGEPTPIVQPVNPVATCRTPIRPSVRLRRRKSTGIAPSTTSFNGTRNSSPTSIPSSFTLPGIMPNGMNAPSPSPSTVDSTKWSPAPLSQSQQQQFICNHYPSPACSTTNDRDPPTEWHMPLHIAVEQGHEATVKAILDAGVDINECDSGGLTALHIAVRTKQEGMLRLLLKHNADVNAFDTFGWTPIHRAAQTGFTPGLKLLLAYGGDLMLRAPRQP